MTRSTQVVTSDVRERIELDRDDEALLMVIFEAQEPVGARLAARMMNEKGLALSEASVSRGFARLDSLGLSVGKARKGRVLTSSGRKFIEERIQHEKRNAVFHRALDLRTIEEILDWLRARELLEGQAAELAALRASDDQLAQLEDSVREHVGILAGGSDPTPTGLQFHKLLMEASGSPIFIALIGSLYTPNLLMVERALDVILNNRGTLGNSAEEHEVVLTALRARDAEAARRAMCEHLSRLQVETKRFAEEAAAGSLPEILQLIDAARSSSLSEPDVG